MTIDLLEEKAAAELLELVRVEDAANFDLSITTAEGARTVSIQHLDIASHTIGEGASFREAWFDQKPFFAKDA